jgi:hypothetical protein
MENEDPVPVVTKLIDRCMYKDLHDPQVIYEQDEYFYSPTMYIKKGIIKQPEAVALQVLEVLQDFDAEDRYYAKERIQQPADAVGMPQRILDLQRKKWIRSDRLEEEHEDHQRKLRYEVEEIKQRDQLSQMRHMTLLEQREDLALQQSEHATDEHMRNQRFRIEDHNLNVRQKMELLDSRLGEMGAQHQMRQSMDTAEHDARFSMQQQTRNAQLEYDRMNQQQKLGYLDQEQVLRLTGAQNQQQLRLDGMASENALKQEQMMEELRSKQAAADITKDELAYRLQNFTQTNMGKLQTAGQMESITLDSKRQKNLLEDQGRQAQLEWQQQSDMEKLRTQASMNQYDHEKNQDTMRTKATIGQIERDTVRDKNSMMQADRYQQLQFNNEANRQKLDVLRTAGQIQNTVLAQKNDLQQQDRQQALRFTDASNQMKLETLAAAGNIQNQTLTEKNALLHQDRVDQLNFQEASGNMKLDFQEAGYTNERQQIQFRDQSREYNHRMKMAEIQGSMQAQAYSVQAARARAAIQTAAAASRRMLR